MCELVTDPKYAYGKAGKYVVLTCLDCVQLIEKDYCWVIRVSLQVKLSGICEGRLHWGLDYCCDLMQFLFFLC